MEIYIILLFVLLVFSFSKDKKLLYISFFLLLITFVLRSIYVGTDTYNYFYMFNMINDVDLERTEYLWRSLNHMVHFLGGNFSVVLLIAGLLTLCPLYYVIIKSSRKPNLSILLYYLLWYYFYSFNIIRQSIASSFIFLGVYFFIHKKYKWAFFYAIIASLFHTLALVAIPIFIAVYLYPSFKKIRTYLIYLVISILIGLYVGPKIFGFIADRFFEVYSYYTELMAIDLLDAIKYLFLSNILFLMVLKYGSYRSQWFQFYFLGTLIVNVSILFPYGERISSLVGMVQIIVFPYFFDNNRIYKSKVFFILAFVLFLGIGFYLKIINNVSGIIPYKFN